MLCVKVDEHVQAVVFGVQRAVWGLGLGIELKCAGHQAGWLVLLPAEHLIDYSAPPPSPKVVGNTFRVSVKKVVYCCIPAMGMFF